MHFSQFTSSVIQSFPVCWISHCDIQKYIGHSSCDALKCSPVLNMKFCKAKQIVSDYCLLHMLIRFPLNLISLSIPPPSALCKKYVSVSRCSTSVIVSVNSEPVLFLSFFCVSSSQQAFRRQSRHSPLKPIWTLWLSFYLFWGWKGRVRIKAV